MKTRKLSLIPGLAPEGLPFVLIGAVLVIACLVVPGWLGALVFCVYIAFAVWFFRDPERVSPFGDDLIISPADGRVLEVEYLDKSPYTNEPTRKVGIFMSPFNVHVNRSPISGVVEGVFYKQGGFVKADLPQASLANEHNAVVIRRDDGARVMFMQVSGLVARRIVCYLLAGDRVERGSRVGMIRFGSRVDVYMPPNSEVVVKVGEKVKAGESILGRLAWH
jgi:phosphatidylserine decarboxylase